MGKTISTHNGSAAHRGHNVRDKWVVENQDHIDPALSGNNLILHDEKPREAYRRIFGAALARFNEKQTRPERRIKDYYSHIEKDAKKHSVYEMIIQVGDRNDTGLDAPVEKKCLLEFYEGWKDRNPNLECIGAYLHADEKDGTVHMHIDYVPVAHGYKRGMDTQTGLVKALGEMGFQKQGKETAQIQWERRENEALETICRANGIEVEHPGRKEKHLETKLYKIKQEVSEATCELQEAQEQARDVKDSLIPVRAEYEAKRAYIEQINLSSDKRNPPGVKPKKAILGLGKVKSYTVPAEIWHKASASWNANVVEKAVQDKWREQMQEYEKTPIVQENKRLRQEVKELESKIDELNVVRDEQGRKNEELLTRNIALIEDHGRRQEFQERVLERVLNRISPNFSHTFYNLWKQEEQAEKRLQAYRNQAYVDEDRYTICQLKEEHLRTYGFLEYKLLSEWGQGVSKDRYKAVYFDVLAPNVTLDDIFRKFNVEPPADYTGRNMTMSDVVVLHQNGQDTAWYCDLVGWQEVPEFLGRRRQKEVERVMRRDDDELEL